MNSKEFTLYGKRVKQEKRETTINCKGEGVSMVKTKNNFFWTFSGVLYKNLVVENS